MIKQFTNKKHKLLSKLRYGRPRRRIIANTTKRSMSAAAIGVTVVTMGVAGALLPSVPAFADTDYYTCDQEVPALCIYDTGLHNIEAVGSATNYIGYDPVGTYGPYEEYELKIQDGSDCLTQSTTNAFVYDEVCSTATNKLWIRVPQGGGIYALQSVWMLNSDPGVNCYLTSHNGNGDELADYCDIGGSAYDEWSLTGVG
jgi:hypothetical protein